jgi:tRNA pseudouridine13 synthase
MRSVNTPLPNWHHAHGSPLFQGLIKQSPKDFEVVECLDFELSGDGEHDFLWIEKEGANTAWVAKALAKYAGVPERDAGYAGLKDRQAVTRQWFSVRRPDGSGTDWESFELAGVSILESTRHLKKLKRGAHSGNRFRIAVRAADASSADIDERLKLIRDSGVPNYFGPQRFGRGGNNLQLAGEVFAGKRMKRAQRSIALSSARSFVFNEILSARVSDGSWNQALPGEALNLDGTGSFFVAEEIDKELIERLRSMDIHPTGALWGRGESKCRDAAAKLEQDIAGSWPELTNGLEKAGLTMSRRPLRLAVGDLSWEISGNTLWLEFHLRRGSYATSVLRELANVNDG